MTNPPLRLAVAAMGTRFELALLAGSGNLRAAGEAAIEEIEAWHRRLSRFSPDSLLSHINRTASRTPVSLDRETYELFDDALRVWRESGGAFDITVAPLMAACGFADSAVSARAGWADGAAVALDAHRWTISLAGPHIALDLGGIAKGHALDCAASLLRGAGITRALLHGGTSSVVAIGAPEDGDRWRVAVRREADDDVEVVTMRDTAMSVSNGSSQKSPGAANGHIVDPRTGGASATAEGAVVIGPSARVADAWSTALVVLGRVPRGFPPGFTAYLGGLDPGSGLGTRDSGPGTRTRDP